MNRIPVKWVEHYDNESPRVYQFKTNASQVTMVVDVDAVDLPVFLYSVLGYAKNTSPGILNRRTPARHPGFPWMVCTEISNCHGVKFRKYENSDLGQVYTTFVPLARYARERMTLLFEIMPYNILEDDQIYGVPNRSEFDRYVTKGYVEPSAKVLTVNAGDSGSQFKWAEGPRKGDAINFGVGHLVPEYMVRWTWHQVPESSLFGAIQVLGAGGQQGFQNVPVFIQQVIGCVNNDTFGGYPAGTLLLVGVKLLPEFAPVQPVIMGLDKLTPPMLYKVDYQVLYNPRGHNKAPFRNNGPLQWLAFTTTGELNGQPLYNPVDYHQLFQSL